MKPALRRPMWRVRIKTQTRREGRRISRKQWRRQNAAQLRRGRKYLKILMADKRSPATIRAQLENKWALPDTREHADEAFVYGVAAARFDGKTFKRVPMPDMRHDLSEEMGRLSGQILGALYLGDLFKPRGGKG